MSDWAHVPQGHRGRTYEWQGERVRCICPCRWRSTLARDVVDARRLWDIHIRSLVKGPKR